MTFRLASFLRTTLPLDLAQSPRMDGGRYHSIWLPDHMVSFWPDAIWTPEFTDLATRSHSPHRQLDALAVAAAVAPLIGTAQIATSVVDTVRRHPAMLAQTALTISHLAKGRFILGIGAGERENCVPYGFSMERSVSRFEEALKVIRLLWDSDGPVDFAGDFFRLEHARLDTEPFEGNTPPIWIGASGPRMLGIAGRLGDGWWPAGMYGPGEYAAKLAVLRQAAEAAGRDPAAVTPAYMIACLLGEKDEVREIVRQPLVKAFALQMTGESFHRHGFRHPMGDGWRGILDVEPDKLGRADLLAFIEAVDEAAILANVPHGTPAEVAHSVKAYADAGVRVATIIDYGGMAGLAYAGQSAAWVRELEDRALQLINGSDGDA
jgi:phthiodiolone/phenolphthiodiolone dimycocerosates ketoreductase